MLSIAVGLAVLLWLQCLIAGRNENMISTITSTYTGHLQVADHEYRKSHLTSKTFVPIENAALTPFTGRYETAQRIHLPALASSGEDSVPLMLEGIEPENEAKITRLKSSLTRGEYLTEGDYTDCANKEIYVGESLAAILKVDLGQKLVILAQANDGTLGNELLRVKGIFSTGSPDFDKSFAFTHKSCVQSIGALQGIHELVIGLDSSRLEGEMTAALTTGLPVNLRVTTWREAMPAVATMIRYNDASFKMITVVLFSVIALGVINTLLMSVFERLKEFGVMIALGTRPFQLQSLVLLECFFVAIFSSALGTVFGSIAVFYHRQVGFDLTPFLGEQTGAGGFSFDLIIHPIFELVPFLKLVGIIVALIMCAGLVPAFRASRLDPVEVMRS
ncbi:MAG: FtsX-like permease family protein [Bdellovibrionota bacterium]